MARVRSECRWSQVSTGLEFADVDAGDTMTTMTRFLFAVLMAMMMAACASDGGPDAKPVAKATTAGSASDDATGWGDGDVTGASDTAATKPAGAASAKVECPPLTRVKYPFISCAKDEHGQIVFAGPVQVLEGSQMPPLDPYVVTNSYIGN
jgi:hypothetical protein